MSNQAIIWDFFKEKGLSEQGIAGMMGNIEAESGFQPEILQYKGQSALGMTGAQYTKAVDDGTYKNYVNDGYGHGICQWTSANRKENLKSLAKARGTSVGDLFTQMEQLWDELNGNYSKTLSVLKTATTVAEASNMFMLDFERPGDQSTEAQAIRSAMGEKWFALFSTVEEEVVAVHWARALEEKVVAQGLITPGKDLDSNPTWGEFCVVMSGMLEKMGVK